MPIASQLLDETSTLDFSQTTPPAVSERRGEARSAVSLMRAAKLICPTGEYICLLRDISPGGVKLRMFHSLPTETRASLKLAQGEAHPAVRVWEHGTTAGFRFLRPINPEKVLAMPGKTEDREIRISLSAPGTISSGGFTQKVVLRSLSQSSARIETDGYLALCQSLILSVEGLGEHRGWVRWRRSSQYEIAFESMHPLNQLATQALALQPMSPRETISETPRYGTL